MNSDEEPNDNPDEMILKDMIIIVLKALPDCQGSAHDILGKMIEIFGAEKVYSLGYNPIGIENQNDASEEILK